MADELDVLLDKVDDPSLRAELRAHVDRLRARRSFGLVFEDHIPERVHLPEHPIRRGVRVVRRDDAGGESLEVLSVRRGEATVAGRDGAMATVPVGELLDPAVRAAVRSFEGGQVTALYESDAARPYA